MGFSFKNLFKKDKPQEDTEHVSLEKSAESDSAKTEARAKHKKGEVVIADSGNVKEVSRVMLKFDQLGQHRNICPKHTDLNCTHLTSATP